MARLAVVALQLGLQVDERVEVVEDLLALDDAVDAEQPGGRLRRGRCGCSLGQKQAICLLDQSPSDIRDNCSGVPSWWEKYCSRDTTTSCDMRLV